jgi:hypothetical protein
VIGRSDARLLSGRGEAACHEHRNKLSGGGGFDAFAGLFEVALDLAGGDGQACGDLGLSQPVACEQHDL